MGISPAALLLSFEAVAPAKVFSDGSPSEMSLSSIDSLEIDSVASVTSWDISLFSDIRLQFNTSASDVTWTLYVLALGFRGRPPKISASGDTS